MTGYFALFAVVIKLTGLNDSTFYISTVPVGTRASATERLGPAQFHRLLRQLDAQNDVLAQGIGNGPTPASFSFIFVLSNTQNNFYNK